MRRANIYFWLSYTQREREKETIKSMLLFYRNISVRFTHVNKFTSFLISAVSFFFFRIAAVYKYNREKMFLAENDREKFVSLWKYKPITRESVCVSSNIRSGAVDETIGFVFLRDRISARAQRAIRACVYYKTYDFSRRKSIINIQLENKTRRERRGLFSQFQVLRG